jgi:PAS domain S-box-containing protein
MVQPETERSRLQEAERRQRILSDVSRLLLDYVGADEIEPLRRIVREVAGAMANGWCAFSLVQPDGTLRNVAAYHPDPRQRELEQKLNALVPPRPWDREPKELNALLMKRPVVTGQISDEMLRGAVPDEQAFRMLKEVGITSAIVAPMFDGSAPLGTLLLATTGAGHRYTAEDADFAYSLAGRAALAVRNARLVGQLAAERDRQAREREQADRRFAELRAVFDSDPNGIALFDAQGILRLASQRLEEIFGVPVRSMYGQRFDEIYRLKLEQVLSGDRQTMLDRVRSIFANQGEPSSDEIELERPRYRALTRVTTPVRVASGEYLGRLVVYTDVTEQRELDRQRADFLTVAAHELRTPLTPLSMYLQSIERRLARGQSVGRELVSKARRQVDRLGRLVEDLLDISRMESRRLLLGSTDVELNDLVDDVVGDFRAQTRNHDILFHRTGAPVLIQGDRERLEQVMVNLLQNAIKYTPQGGQIRVTVERQEKEARISVQDPGIGIPGEEQARLFQRFFRAANATTRNYSGLGIGLYVSHEIVHRHGGRFEVHSEMGEGSTFTFYLPLSPRALLAPDAQQRLLLVDDDPEILEATGQVLREWGYAVDAASDGEMALLLARKASPDLALIDLLMPAMDGWTLIERLRKEGLPPDVPVVVFSADRELRDDKHKLEVDAALRKPFELEELQDLVERLLRPRPAA